MEADTETYIKICKKIRKMYTFRAFGQENTLYFETWKRTFCVLENTENTFDEDKLASAIKKSSVSKELQRINLISKIQELPDKEIVPANSLISLMRYSKGPNKDDIISPYLQQKMHNHLVQPLYKCHNTHKFLKEQIAENLD
ncbi:hypothetical protein C2G38_2233594 [Gigaspora rosea]|uniref:Uncharacterized protein n=1 Tax=Gigaspora rosea TaxID=44941 RepID=A0A397TRK5_9GLOM|nr:hypothetical protein C2G38_2233594 [Gigaspora rosea]